MIITVDIPAEVFKKMSGNTADYGALIWKRFDDELKKTVKSEGRRAQIELDHNIGLVALKHAKEVKLRNGDYSVFFTLSLRDGEI